MPFLKQVTSPDRCNTTLSTMQRKRKMLLSMTAVFLLCAWFLMLQVTVPKIPQDSRGTIKTKHATTEILSLVELNSAVGNVSVAAENITAFENNPAFEYSETVNAVTSSSGESSFLQSKYSYKRYFCSIYF